MNTVLLQILILCSFAIGLSANENYKTYCLILEDENSIVCKYTSDIKKADRVVSVNWIDPNGSVSRSRELTILAGHMSIYDFRYLRGREIGEWKFEVIDADITTSTTFIIESKKDQ